MSKAKTFLGYFLVLLLGFSHLIFLEAVPTSRTRSIMYGALGQKISEKNHLATEKKTGYGAEHISGRMMVVELNDYPGSGANNRHIPRPGQRCFDC